MPVPRHAACVLPIAWMSQDHPIPRTPGDDSAVGSPMLPDRPAYDDLLDAALEYTFPASDPISVDAGCARIDAADKA